MLHKISIIGAGNVGATCAQRILENELADVIMLDVIDGIPQGKALDLNEAAPIENYSAIAKGSIDYESTANSDIIIITAGIPRQAGMSRDTLIKTNAEIIHDVVKGTVKYSPNSVIIIVTNPLDIMCYVAYNASGFPPERIIGEAGVLDSARFRFFIAEALNISVESTYALVIGSHNDSMVPLPRYSSVAGIPITELLSSEKIAKLCERAAEGGTEIVNLLKTGNVHYAPASAAYEIADAILKDKRKILPCSAYLTGQYGYNDLFIGVPVKLGRGGVQEIIELQLLPEEKAALDRSANSILNLLNLLTVWGY